MPHPPTIVVKAPYQRSPAKGCLVAVGFRGCNLLGLRQSWPDRFSYERKGCSRRQACKFDHLKVDIWETLAMRGSLGQTFFWIPEGIAESVTHSIDLPSAIRPNNCLGSKTSNPVHRAMLMDPSLFFLARLSQAQGFTI